MIEKEAAILIVGHLRDCERHYDTNFKNIFSNLESYDIFMNIIEDENYPKHKMFNPVIVKKDFNSPENIDYFNQFLFDHLATQGLLAYYKKREKARRIKEDSLQKHGINNSEFKKYAQKRYYCYALSKLKIFETQKIYQKEKRINYKWVVFYRPDLVIKNHIDFKKLQPLKLNAFFHKFPFIEFPLIDDRFAIGSQNIMGIYANLPHFYNNYKFNSEFLTKWSKIKYNVKEYHDKKNNDLTDYHAEIMLTQHLESNNIPFNSLNERGVKAFTDF